MTRRWWVRVGWARALAEGWLLTVLLLAALLSLYPELPGSFIQQGMMFTGPAAALWLTARWRLRASGGWGARLLQTLAVGALFGGVVGLMFYGVTDWLARQTPPAAGIPALNLTPLFLALIFSSAIVSFLGFRIADVIRDVWSRLQRRHLLWSIVQDHLLVAVVVQLVFVVPMTLNYASSNTFVQAAAVESSPTASLAVRIVIGILPILSIFTILGLLVLFAVLPLSAIASYLVARRTIRRLRALTEATAALRAGDYDARVPVTGEDEIAALQADFNAMAADLGANVRALQAERETVAALLRARRDLVASVSHELRTPVTILRSYLEDALGRASVDAPLQRDMTTMQAEVLRLQTLIDDLFALSRADVEALELSLGPVDVAAVVADVVRTAAPLAWQSQRVELVADVAGDLPLARADTMRLEQVLRNLINNGVRHAAPGGVVAVRAAADPDAVVVSVSDTGAGIDPAHLPHIWDRYFHTADGGSGLGLALVRSLVQAMGGSVAVDSRVGEGSTFSVRLNTVTSDK